MNGLDKHLKKEFEGDENGFGRDPLNEVGIRQELFKEANSVQ
jgi:hypothetical protein